MSEMFTKCNGFIVSGDPLVYADSATMTGQGTVSEPFGVKNTDLFVQEPLYTGTSGSSAYIGWNNETVLWEGTNFSVTDGSHLSATVQLSEPISAFDEIKIISSGNLDSETIVLDTSKTGSNGAFTWIAPEGGNANWIGLRGVFTDQTHLKVYGGYSTTLGSIFTSNGWWSYKNIYKVVGINRKV